jgi:hypothetical protein
VSAFLAWIRSPCLRHCVHGAAIGGGGDGGGGGAALDSAAFAARHPRFDALNSLYEDVRHEKYGVDAQKSRLSSNLIEIQIRCSLPAHVEKAAVVSIVAG